MIACDPHGHYLVPGLTAWVWACISCTSQLENVTEERVDVLNCPVSIRRTEMTLLSIWQVNTKYNRMDATGKQLGDGLFTTLGDDRLAVFLEFLQQGC